MKRSVGLAPQEVDMNETMLVVFVVVVVVFFFEWQTSGVVFSRQIKIKSNQNGNFVFPGFPVPTVKGWCETLKTRR